MNDDGRVVLHTEFCIWDPESRGVRRYQLALDCIAFAWATVTW